MKTLTRIRRALEWLTTKDPLGTSEVVHAAVDEVEELERSLSPPTPEDVARWYEEVAKAYHHPYAREALARLRDWAARVPGLEEKVAALGNLAVERGAKIDALTSERDAARREAERLGSYVEKLKVDVSGHVGTIHEQHDTISTLGERVATLEERCRVAETAQSEATKNAAAYRNSAEAAERRVQEVEGLLRESKEWMGKATTALDATHPAPAGLLEAVGAVMPWAQAVLDSNDANAPDDHAFYDVEFGRKGQSLTAGDLRRLLAAYDAAKGDDYDRNRHLYEPTVTHAALAAAVEEYARGVAKEALSPHTKKKEQQNLAGRAIGAREVLRRVTGGRVPESNVSALRKVAQDWLNVLEADGAACTCEPLDRCPLCRVRRALAGVPAGEATLPVVRVASAIRAQVHATDVSPDWRGGANAVAVALGITLDTPPSGPGGGEAAPSEGPGHEPADADALLAEWRQEAAPRSVLVPTPTPEWPALAGCRRLDPLGGPTCAALGCGEHGADKPCQWPAQATQPEPAAPEVAFDLGNVRMLADDTVQWRNGRGEWCATSLSMVVTLARALAEAKRENAVLREERDAARQETGLRSIEAENARIEGEQASRKAAESMRERCVYAAGEYAEVLNGAARTAVLALRDRLHALPLEDK